MADPLHPLESPTPREREHLETAHHEICTALTVLWSNMELVRVELRREPEGAPRAALQTHLTELDAASQRLKRLTVELRRWHGGSPKPRRIDGPTLAPHTRLLP